MTAMLLTTSPNLTFLISILPDSQSMAVEYAAVSPFVEGMKKISSSTVFIGTPTFSGSLHLPVLKSYCDLKISYPPMLFMPLLQKKSVRPSLSRYGKSSLAFVLIALLRFTGMLHDPSGSLMMR